MFVGLKMLEVTDQENPYGGLFEVKVLFYTIIIGEKVAISFDSMDALVSMVCCTVYLMYILTPRL